MIDYENLKKLNEPFMEEFSAVFDNVLKSGWYILGNEVKNFEEQFAEYCGAKYCVGVGNGLEALTLSIIAYNFPAKSEIVVSSNTYIATILAIVNAGHIPVLVEPNINTYNIDIEKIEEKITDKTVAILPTHLYGRPADMKEIISLAHIHNLVVIEDAAQAHGANIDGHKVGSFGDITCFSFYPTKNLGALGDGGAITTDNKYIAERVRSLRNYGSGKKYYNDYIGYNSRLDEMQAAFLKVKLHYLDDINAHKNYLANIYYKRLKDTSYILPAKQDNYYMVYHIFNIRHKKRDELKQFLLQNDIKTDIHYPVSPVHQKALSEYFKGVSTPIADDINSTTLSLPISYIHTREDINRVCDALLQFDSMCN